MQTQRETILTLLNQAEWVIPLSQGKYAQVDPDDYQWLSQWKWSYYDGYAYRRDYTGAKPVKIWMHKLIMCAATGQEVDHKNGDTLDNRKDNLRLATHQQNSLNRGKRRGSSSRFKGVSKRGTRWLARIYSDQTYKYLGYFDNERKAAKAYDRVAVELHGEFARLNFPPARI